MRVFHLCSSTLDTHYFTNLCEGIQAKGIPLLCGTFSEKTPPRWLNEPEKNYFCLNAMGRHSYPGAIRRLAQVLRRERIDILQTHLFDGGLVGVLAARLARTPLTIVTRHHLDQVRLIGTRFHVYLDGWMARQADRVVVLSQAVRNYMMESDHVDGNKIEVIYQGFDFQRFSSTEAERQRVREELGIESRFVLGCIGSLHKTKGHIYLFQALKELAAEIPNVCVLVLGDGDRDLIKNMVRDLELEDRVIFAGFRRDVPACMAAMDIVVHPSLSEAFCQVLIETMSVGTPLVATDVGGAAEVVTHGETGTLLPPADPAAISKAVMELYRNPEQRQHIALAGQTSVRSRFTIERMVNQQVDCYQRWLREAESKSGVKLEAKYRA